MPFISLNTEEVSNMYPVGCARWAHTNCASRLTFSASNIGQAYILHEVFSAHWSCNFVVSILTDLLVSVYAYYTSLLSPFDLFFLCVSCFVRSIYFLMPPGLRGVCAIQYTSTPFPEK